MRLPGLLSRPATPTLPADPAAWTPDQLRARLAEIDHDRQAKREQLHRALAPLQSEALRLRTKLAGVEQDIARLEGQCRDWELSADNEARVLVALLPPGVPDIPDPDNEHEPNARAVARLVQKLRDGRTNRSNLLPQTPEQRAACHIYDEEIAALLRWQREVRLQAQVTGNRPDPPEFAKHWRNERIQQELGTQ